MKKFIATAFSILMTLAGQSQDAKSVISQTINKIEKSKTISYFTQQKWGDLADQPNFTDNEGTCIFKIVPTDTVIGAWYLFQPKDLSQIYDGQQLSKVEWKDSTMSVTDLQRYPDQARYITTAMLYTNSVMDLCRLMKELKPTPDKMRLLNDTIINGVNCKRVLLIIGDGIVNNERLYWHKTIAIDAKTYLPVHCISVCQSEYGKQIIECWMSRYKLNDPAVDAQSFAGERIPGYVKRIQYTPEARKEAFRLAENLPAPNFTLPKVTGGAFDLKETKGKVVLLEFSGVHCMYCLVAVKDLLELRHSLDSSKFQIVSVYSDEPEDKMKAYVAKYKIEYPLLSNYKDGKSGKALLEQYGVGGIPHFFLLNQAGDVVWNSVGYSPDLKEEIKQKVQELLPLHQ